MITKYEIDRLSVAGQLALLDALVWLKDDGAYYDVEALHYLASIYVDKLDMPVVHEVPWWLHWLPRFIWHTKPRHSPSARKGARVGDVARRPA